MHAREMISAHPDVKGSISEPLITCIEGAPQAHEQEVQYELP
jgi:hypothetical protein